MNKKKVRTIIITVAAAVIILLAVAVIALVIKNKQQNELPPVPVDTTALTEKFVIPAIGDDIILPTEYETIFDAELFEEIERIEKGVPANDENGNYYTDEMGNLVFDAESVIDYTNIKQNLSIIISVFANKGYSIDANRQVQRLYIHYAKSLSGYEFEEMTEKLAECIPALGTNSEALTEKAREVFGFIRDDGFPFVFETVPTADISVRFCDVKPYGESVLTERQKKLCIYSDWCNGECLEDERNLEAWLERIVVAFDSSGYSDKNIIIAQLIYAGSVANTEYVLDLTDVLMRCLIPEFDTDREFLRAALWVEFGVSIEDNVALCDYLDGVTVYGRGV